MKKVVLLVLVSFLAWHYINRSADHGLYAGVLPPAPKERIGTGLSTIQFTDLLDAKRSLGDLARPDYYTVVEVYLDTCQICKRLESNYPEFLRKRRDVLVRKVHFPEEGLQLNFAGSSREEVKSRASALQVQMDSYQICGTPHIEVYDPSGQLLARDVCGKKRGLSYLREWIGSELGRPASSI